MDELEYVENEDGSVDIVQPDQPEAVRGGQFDQNLVETLPSATLSSLASEILELVEIDKSNREARDKQYAEGIRRTGLGDDPPDSAPMPGATNVVHPVLIEACIDYGASVMKEIFPPDGPVKTKILSSNAQDQNIIQKAENKRDFLNWQLTSEIPEYRSALEVMFLQQPLGGSQFLKFWMDSRKKRINVEFVPIDQVYLPSGANDLYSSSRFTISLELTRDEFKSRVNGQMYVDPGLMVPAFTGEESQSEVASNKVEGVETDIYNIDGLRTLYEVYIDYEIEEEIGIAPYIITIDKYNRQIVAIYRNWDGEEDGINRKDWVVEFPFIPWRGSYGIGLYHLIGDLTVAATGALRALLDAAHRNNFPGGLKLKGAGRNSGANVALNPGEFTEIDSTVTDDIRKAVMGLPFNPPSPVLLELLGILVNSAKGVVSVAEEKIKDAGNQMPVGTALALIEQGSKVFSSIHARQHIAQERVLKIIDRLNFENYDPQKQIRVFGKVMVEQEDFRTNSFVAPVSDPNIFSESQRFAQNQAVLQLSTDQSVPWNKIAIYRRMMATMHIENPDELLPAPPRPVSADPITEITAAMSGQQIQAMPQMDHLQHINEELFFLEDPVFGAANPFLVNPGFAVILADIAVHLNFLFQSMRQMSLEFVTNRVVQLQVEMLVTQLGLDQNDAAMQVKQQLSQPQAQNLIYQQARQIFVEQRKSIEPLVQRLTAVKQLVESKAPPQMNPELQIAQLQIAATEKRDQGLLQLKAEEMKSKQIGEIARLTLEQQQQEFEQRMSQWETMLSEQMDRLAQQAAIQRNDDDNRQHQLTELLKNHEDNQTNLMMEQMRQEGLQSRHELTEYMKAQAAKMDLFMESIMSQFHQPKLEEHKPDGSND